MVELPSLTHEPQEIDSSLVWWDSLGDGWEAHAESAKNEFAIQLSRAIERLAINRSEFAKLLETSPAYVSKLLRGDSNCSIETMAHAAYVLGERLCIAVAPCPDDGKWVYTKLLKVPASTAPLDTHAGKTSTVFTVTQMQPPIANGRELAA